MEKNKELLPWQKAHITEKNALTFTKYKLNKEGWRYVDFQSKKGFPRTGIIDLIAVKLDGKDCDKLKIVLFQVKGGLHERVSKEEIARLKSAVKKVEITYSWSEKPDKTVNFHNQSPNSKT